MWSSSIKPLYVEHSFLYLWREGSYCVIQCLVDETSSGPEGSVSEHTFIFFCRESQETFRCFSYFTLVPQESQQIVSCSPILRSTSHASISILLLPYCEGLSGFHRNTQHPWNEPRKPGTGSPFFKVLNIKEGTVAPPHAWLGPRLWLPWTQPLWLSSLLLISLPSFLNSFIWRICPWKQFGLITSSP